LTFWKSVTAVQSHGASVPLNCLPIHAPQYTNPPLDGAVVVVVVVVVSVVVVAAVVVEAVVVVELVVVVVVGVELVVVAAVVVEPVAVVSVDPVVVEFVVELAPWQELPGQGCFPAEAPGVSATAEARPEQRTTTADAIKATLDTDAPPSRSIAAVK